MEDPPRDPGHVGKVTVSRGAMKIRARRCWPIRRRLRPFRAAGGSRFQGKNNKFERPLTLPPRPRISRKWPVKRARGAPRKWVNGERGLATGRKGFPPIGGACAAPARALSSHFSGPRDGERRFSPRPLEIEGGCARGERSEERPAPEAPSGPDFDGPRHRRRP